MLLVLPLVALLLFLSPGEWWRHLHSEMAVKAIRVTLSTTALATAISVAGGLPMAYLLARGEFRGRVLLDALIDLPVTIPPVVAGVALLLAFGRNGLIGRYLSLFGVEIGFTGIAVVMAQVFISCPFFIKTACAGFQGIDPAYERAARTLGASAWQAFWLVLLPLARPSLLAGVVLAWAAVHARNGRHRWPGG